MPPQFVSEGAAAGQAIRAFLLEQEQLRRQALLDEFARQKEANDVTQSEEDRKLRREAEARAAADSKATRDALENEREFRRATTIADNALPGDAVDEATRKLLEAQGFGSQLKKIPGVVTQGPQIGTENDVPIYDVTQTPDTFQMRGGSRYLAARTAADERAAEAEKTRSAADARAQADRDLRELIARMQTSSSEETKGLRNDLLRIQTALAQDKLDAGRQDQVAKTEGTKSVRAQIRDLASGLLSDPNLEAIAGPIAGRTPDVNPDSVDVARRLEQLVSSLALGERSKLKGQGQISDYEAKILANSVSALDRRAGGANLKKHLQEIVDAFTGDTPQAAAPRRQIRYDMQGRPLP